MVYNDVQVGNDFSLSWGMYWNLIEGKYGGVVFFKDGSGIMVGDQWGVVLGMNVMIIFVWIKFGSIGLFEFIVFLLVIGELG